jgi:hypothetical protein
MPIRQMWCSAAEREEGYAWAGELIVVVVIVYMPKCEASSHIQYGDNLRPHPTTGPLLRLCLIRTGAGRLSSPYCERCRY